MTRNIPAHFPCLCLFGFWIERSKKQQFRALVRIKDTQWYCREIYGETSS